jgi:hypothetical protein
MFCSLLDYHEKFLTQVLEIVDLVVCAFCGSAKRSIFVAGRSISCDLVYMHPKRNPMEFSY